MGDKSGIEWTDATISPIRSVVKGNAREIAEEKGYKSLLPIIQPGRIGPHCEKPSAGCLNCYSEANNKRCLPHNGTGLPFDRRSRDLLDHHLDLRMLAKPMQWTRPRNIFICSQTDLFGEWVPFGMIDTVFAVMSLANHHTYQILTKRPARMREYLEALEKNVGTLDGFRPHIRLGVSVEDQETANKRVPHLLKIFGFFHWVSYEPALAPVDFEHLWYTDEDGNECLWNALTGYHEVLNSTSCDIVQTHEDGVPKLDQIVVGMESGRHARVGDLEWVSGTIDAGKRTGVAIYVKQLGKAPRYHLEDGTITRLKLKNKGGDIDEWPEKYRVRETVENWTPPEPP